MALLDRWIASRPFQLKATPEAKGPKMAVCVVCEKIFKPRDSCQLTCSKECRLVRKIDLSRERRRNTLSTKMAFCLVCEKGFAKKGNDKTCGLKCSRERRHELRRERNQRPEVKERTREFDRERRHRPEVRDRKREYMREYEREYCQRPAVRVRKREIERKYRRKSQQRPEVRERKRKYMREYHREYCQRPEIRDRKREHSRFRYAAKRHGISPRQLAHMQNKVLYRFFQEDSHATEADRQP